MQSNITWNGEKTARPLQVSGWVMGNYKLHQMHGTQRSSRSGGKGYVFLWAVLS